MTPRQQRATFVFVLNRRRRRLTSGWRIALTGNKQKQTSSEEGRGFSSDDRAAEADTNTRKKHLHKFVYRKCRKHVCVCVDNFHI